MISNKAQKILIERSCRRGSVIELGSRSGPVKKMQSCIVLSFREGRVQVSVGAFWDLFEIMF